MIRSLDDPVVRYLPTLKGSGYESVSIRNLLKMASGVRWNETYTDPFSDRRKMLDIQMTQQPGSLLRFMTSLPRIAPPGTSWNYNTGETYVLGALAITLASASLYPSVISGLYCRAGSRMPVFESRGLTNGAIRVHVVERARCLPRIPDIRT
ncbi:MAG: beta-lactamase family protein, partial [Acidobacteriaceae bacterium]|nr:beta-lactamase family protein [Acidobacteriaceae bacterium]